MKEGGSPRVMSNQPRTLRVALGGGPRRLRSQRPDYRVTCACGRVSTGQAASSSRLCAVPAVRPSYLSCRRARSPRQPPGPANCRRRPPRPPSAGDRFPGFGPGSLQRRCCPGGRGRSPAESPRRPLRTAGPVRGECAVRQTAGPGGIAQGGPVVGRAAPGPGQLPPGRDRPRRSPGPAAAAAATLLL